MKQKFKPGDVCLWEESNFNKKFAPIEVLIIGYDYRRKEYHAADADDFNRQLYLEIPWLCKKSELILIYRP